MREHVMSCEIGRAFVFDLCPFNLLEMPNQYHWHQHKYPCQKRKDYHFFRSQNIP